MSCSEDFVYLRRRLWLFLRYALHRDCELRLKPVTAWRCSGIILELAAAVREARKHGWEFL
jgi:hypothetical protein